MSAVSLSVETIATATGSRVRVTLSGQPADVAELYRRLDTPGLPPAAGTTVVNILDSTLHPTVPAPPGVPRVAAPPDRG